MSSQNLELNQRQSLVMTPQLQQTIKILNMNGLELNQEISQMLSQNFMLTLDREEGTVASRSEEEREESESSIIEHLGEELPYDADWRDSYEDWQEGQGEEETQAQNAHRPSLSEHLAEQIAQMPLDDAQREAALVLVYSLDEDGYLREKLEVLAKQHQCSPEALQQALHHVQQCQPHGVGARDLEECLRLQMQALPPQTPHLATVLRIFERYFHYIGRDAKLIKKRLKISDEEYAAAMRLLRSLTPFPATPFQHQESSSIRPEIIVQEKNGISYIELVRNLAPNLYINQQYARLANSSQKESDRLLLGAQLQEARWFLAALEKRVDTIRRVAGAIVALQQDFFQLGEVAMRPLTRREVAEILGIHESTVGRAVNGKFLRCKRGVYELRYFFSNQTGEDQSTTAAKALLQDLIQKENPERPQTDQELSDALQRLGYSVPRRTVAKYRELMNIPVASQRKRQE